MIFQNHWQYLGGFQIPLSRPRWGIMVFVNVKRKSCHVDDGEE